MSKSVKYGASGLSFTIAPNSDRSQNISSPVGIFSGRVKDIILDEKHPKFNEYGGWNSIGTAFIENTVSPSSAESSLNENLTAVIPYFSNIKHYPLINEIVPVLYLANSVVDEDSSAVSLYYLPTVNIWNTQVQNAIPAQEIPTVNDDNYINSVNEAELGSPKRIVNNSSDIKLGNSFNEENSMNNHPLYPYEGDIIYEGRFGNSIRLGSTVKSQFTMYPNLWSSAGTQGDPILILRNGQNLLSKTISKTGDTDPWIPTLEDINTDRSSIYLTSTQQIPITPASNIYDSYAAENRPQNVDSYNGNQIILTSNRLVFNARNDSIILNANNSIHLSSNTSVNVDGKNKIVLASPKLYLGSALGKEGVEIQSVVLGENLNVFLNDIAVFLNTLSIAFRTATDSEGAPIVSLNTIAAEAEILSKNLIQDIESNRLLSKNVKTV
jgi:hypothetical protein